MGNHAKVPLHEIQENEFQNERTATIGIRKYTQHNWKKIQMCISGFFFLSYSTNVLHDSLYYITINHHLPDAAFHDQDIS